MPFGGFKCIQVKIMNISRLWNIILTNKKIYCIKKRKYSYTSAFKIYRLSLFDCNRFGQVSWLINITTP